MWWLRSVEQWKNGGYIGIWGVILPSCGSVVDVSWWFFVRWILICALLSQWWANERRMTIFTTKWQANEQQGGGVEHQPLVLWGWGERRVPTVQVFLGQGCWSRSKLQLIIIRHHWSVANPMPLTNYPQQLGLSVSLHVHLGHMQL